jgi:adenosylcobinamide kinase/adenosylcobinamide-phosphate guanylyltransferase
MLSLVIGGARSGKSRFAQSLAASCNNVAYIATARIEDPEMAARVARHREERPADWVTIEAPLEIARAIHQQAAASETIVLDCLTLWLSNFMWEHRDMTEANLHQAAMRELARAADASGRTHVVLVTNEIGCGIVPESPVSRLFRDIHGWVNQEAARSADWVYHLVAGIAVPIKRPEERR